MEEAIVEDGGKCVLGMSKRVFRPSTLVLVGLLTSTKALSSSVTYERSTNAVTDVSKTDIVTTEDMP